VVKRDIEGLPATRVAASPTAPAIPPVAPLPTDKVIPVNSMRKLIARRLSESMYSAPHYYLTAAIVMGCSR